MHAASVAVLAGLVARSARADASEGEALLTAIDTMDVPALSPRSRRRDEAEIRRALAYELRSAIGFEAFGALRDLHPGPSPVMYGGL